MNFFKTIFTSDISLFIGIFLALVIMVLAALLPDQYIIFITG